MHAVSKGASIHPVCLRADSHQTVELQPLDQDAEQELVDMFDDKTGHLTSIHASFFKHWEALIGMEEQEKANMRRQIWTTSAADRETKNEYGRPYRKRRRS